jgi:hypothetical protein
MTITYIELPVAGLTAGEDGDDILLGNMADTDITSATYVVQYYYVTEAFTLDTATGTQNFTDVTTSVARDTGTGFTMSGSASALSSGDAIFIRSINDAAFSEIFVRVATAGVGTWNLVVSRFNNTTDAWETQTITSDSTNAFKTAGSGTIAFTATSNGTERLRTGDSKYAWTKLEFTDVSGVTVSPVIDRIRVHLDKTAAIDVTEPYRDNDWPTDTQYVFNEERNQVYLVVNHPGPPMGMTATITSADSPYATMAFEYYASDATWKTLTTTSDPSSALSVTGTHAIRWTRPDDWTSMTLTVDDIDTGATATLSLTGYLMRIIRATAPTEDVYYSLGVMSFSSRAFGQTTTGGMPLAEAATISYATYQIGNNSSTSDLTFAVANATTGEMGSFTVAAGRTSSMDESDFKADLDSSVSFTAGQGLMLMQIGGGTITDVHFQLHGT